MDRSASKPVPDDSHSISMEPPTGRRTGRRNGTAQARVSAKVEVEGGGVHVERRFTHEGVHPFDEVTWETRTAAIGNEKGESVFEQKDCEIPTFWSQMATNVVVSKYFRGKLGTPGRETSVKQMISRVADTIGKWGREGGYFATETDAQAFQDELTHLLLHQKMSFNSPVWFNIGVARQQESGFGVLHQQRRGHDGVDPDARQDRGHALQVRQRHGHQPLDDPVGERVARRRRHRERARVLHEGLRRVRRRHQERWHHTSRRQDGHPQRRPSRRRGVHHLQGERGAQGVGAHRGRLRQRLHR